MLNEKKLDWKTYESITKYIYEALGKQSGVKIKCHGNTCKVVGKSGVEHQIDVLTSHSDGIHTYLTAIECKYWKEKVNKDIVMKLAEIIQDAGISKGIIVCKNGFTKDGFDYAKHKNIEIVELREIEENDLSGNSNQIHFGDLEFKINISIERTEIININFGDNRNLSVKNEFDYINFIVIRNDGSKTSLYNYITEFRKDVNPKNKKTEELTKYFEIPNGIIYNRETKERIETNGITIIGQLRKTEDNKNLSFSLVDKVWLIMKSIFNNRKFVFSENGLIKEEK